MPRSGGSRSRHQRAPARGAVRITCQRCGHRFPVSSEYHGRITRCGPCYRTYGPALPVAAPQVVAPQVAPAAVWVNTDDDGDENEADQLRQVLEASVEDAYAFADPHAQPQPVEPEESDDQTIDDRLQNLLTDLHQIQQQLLSFQRIHTVPDSGIIEQVHARQQIDGLVQQLQDLHTTATTIHAEAEEQCTAYQCSICLGTVRQRAYFTGCRHAQFCLGCAQRHARVQRQDYEPVSCPVCRTAGNVIQLHM